MERLLCSGRQPGAVVAVVTIVFLFGATLGAKGQGGQKPSPTAATPAATKPQGNLPAGYVGEQTCLGCHADQVKGYHDGAHGRAWNPRTPMATHGCESCHGPGQAHVDGGGDKTKIRTFQAGMAPADVSAACMTCHTRGDRALWNGSQHASRNLSCITCHSIHAPKSPRGQLVAASQLDVCARCHRPEVQRVKQTSHMPLQEGKMVCTSCHNPHGSTNVRLLAVGNSVNEACESCHADKRGPFLWEHAPVVESCVTCHDPHGSNNDRMLTVRTPFLCQRCHVTSRHPATVYDLYQRNNSTGANRIVGRGCVNCHQNIHGSNSPSGSAFLR